MTTDDIYSDLYGVSPGVIAAIMGVSTLLTPYGVLPSWWVLGYPFVYPEPDFIYSLLWVLGPRAGSWGLHNFVVSNPTLLWATFPLGICNVIFALKVVRYYQDKTSKDSVLRWAIAAFIVPIFALFLQGIIWIVIGFLFDPAMAVGTGPLPYFGPIPIQIAVGLFIVYRIPAPELVTPWRDPDRDESWFIEEEIEESCVGKLFITMEELDEIYKVWD
jgi:membrane protein implicated in regulation of membrane protease activity